MDTEQVASTPVPLWGDVTELCRKAAAEMTNISPMVHTEEFSLLESMSAVEIMDPIMDQCCGLKGSLKEADLFDVQYPPGGMPLTTVVKLFQSLFIYEAAFLDGASLMESINKCIFSWEGAWSGLEKRASVLGGEGLADRAVLAYCKSLVFTTGCQFKAVLAADIYEDEDFQPGYKSFLFDKTLESVSIVAALESVIVELEEQESTDSVVQYVLQTLKTRLQLHTFHHTVGFWIHSTIQEYARLLKQRNANNAAAAARAESGTAAADAENSAETALAALLTAAKKRSQQGCAKIKNLSASTVASLQSLVDLHNAGVSSAGAVAGIYEEILQPADCSEIAFALSNNIVKLHQTGPIRRVALKPYLASVAYMQSICRELVDISSTVATFFSSPIVSSVAQVTAVQTAAASTTNPNRSILTLDTVLHTTLHISASCLHLLTRCYYTAVLYVLSPEMSSLIWASMYAKGLPKALIESDLVTKHWIPSNPSVAVWDTLKGLVVCRSRLLASRLQNIIDLWGVVANEAIFVDNRFHADLHGEDSSAAQLQWCSLWSLQNVITVMDLYMALMLEMDLVAVEEWDYFYWYWDYLCSTGVFTAEKLRTQRYQLDADMYESARLDASRIKLGEDAKKTANKKKKKSSSDSTPAVPQPLPPLPVLTPASVEELLLKGRGMMCRGIYRMCALAGATPVGLGLNARGEPLVNKAEGRYSSWEVKFAHRFKAFAELANPPPLNYADFTKATGRAAASTASTAGSARDAEFLNNLVQGAQLCFQHGRKLFDEARSGTSATSAADKYVQSSIVILTKASVASSVSTMRASMLLKDATATTGKDTDKAKTYALAVNRTYSKHFAVLDFTVDAK